MYVFIYMYLCRLYKYCIYIDIPVKLYKIYTCLLGSTGPQFHWLLDANTLRLSVKIHHPEAVEGAQIDQTGARAD